MKKIKLFTNKIAVCTVAFTIALMSLSSPAISNNNKNLGAATSANSAGYNGNVKTSDKWCANVWNGSCREAAYFIMALATELFGVAGNIDQETKIEVEKEVKMQNLN